MKCSKCETKNDPKNKFCKECGADMQTHTETPVVTAVSELYGREVDILFFIEHFTGKISGIVNPTEDQIGRYREGHLQKVTVEAPNASPGDESIGVLLSSIRQSKEYLSEDFNESHFRGLTPADLKKEYLRLFERILKMKAQRGEMKPPAAK